jgi:hypothetical protein
MIGWNEDKQRLDDEIEPQILQIRVLLKNLLKGDDKTTTPIGLLRIPVAAARRPATEDLDSSRPNGPCTVGSFNSTCLAQLRCQVDD